MLGEEVAALSHLTLGLSVDGGDVLVEHLLETAHDFLIALRLASRTNLRCVASTCNFSLPVSTS